MSLPDDYDPDKANGTPTTHLSMHLGGKGAMKGGSLQELTATLETVAIRKATAPMAIANAIRDTHPRDKASMSIDNYFAASSGRSKSFVDKRIALYKTEMCRAFEEMGFCRYGGRCQFAHSQGELRKVARHPRYKTEVCKTYWEVGSCPYGTRCCFIHNESDLLGSSHETGNGSLLGTSIGEPPITDPRKASILEGSNRLIYARTLNGARDDDLCEDQLWEDEESVPGRISRDLLKLLDD